MLRYMLHSFCDSKVKNLSVRKRDNYTFKIKFVRYWSVCLEWGISFIQHFKLTESTCIYFSFNVNQDELYNVTFILVYFVKNMKMINSLLNIGNITYIDFSIYLNMLLSIFIFVKNEMTTWLLKYHVSLSIYSKIYSKMYIMKFIRIYLRNTFRCFLKSKMKASHR